jgi:single-strand DNA-binding protein
MNKVMLVGNLGGDPELKYTPNGNAVANFSLATNDGYGDNEKTNWHRVVVWNKPAESASKYLAKGSKVAIAGRIEYRSYDDKEGVKRYVTEIIADNVEFLDKKGEEDPF